MDRYTRNFDRCRLLEAWTTRLGLGRLVAHRRLVTLLTLNDLVNLFSCAFPRVLAVSSDWMVLCSLRCLLHVTVTPIRTLGHFVDVLLVSRRVDVTVLGSRDALFMYPIGYCSDVVSLVNSCLTMLSRGFILLAPWARPLADSI